MEHIHLNLYHILMQELWVEFVDQERLQFDEREVLSLWEKVQNEPTFLQPQNSSFTDNTSLNNGINKYSSWSKHAVVKKHKHAN